MNQKERRIYLIKELLKEIKGHENDALPESEDEQKAKLRGLMNIRKAKEISPTFLRIQDEYLQNEIERKGIVDSSLLPMIRDRISLWQGDITLLKCDAVVNAANSAMTGCYRPNHRCIDNSIHTYAGVQLRLTCESIMKAQGFPEPPGKAKITPAYNLPSKWIIHTVGPVVQNAVTENDEKTLASCYRECLRLAEDNALNSIAFCSISTGVFGFSKRRAGEIATAAVLDYLDKSSSIKRVVFNVFSDDDNRIYTELLSR